MRSWLATAVVVILGACEAASAPPAAPTAQAVGPAAILVDRGQTWWAWPTGDVGFCWEYGCGSDEGWLSGPAPMGYGESYLATTLPYGGDPAHKVNTVYFRRDFEVDDPAEIANLRLDAMYDDGFVAYLNGEEFLRVGLPQGGPVDESTPASGHETGNHYESFAAAQAVGKLYAGTNTLAIEVHQVSPSSSDLTFDASLVAETQPAPPPPPAPTNGGIPRRSVWSYWDRGGDLGTSWIYPPEVTSWSRGTAPLGYGEDYLATTVGYGGDPANKYVTTYFSKDFWIEDPQEIDQLEMHLMYDDGAVVYLNGKHIISLGFSGLGPQPNTVYALGHETGNQYERWGITDFKSWLVYGPNTIAVAVHQATPSSSDLTFDFALNARTKPAPTIRPGSVWSYWDRATDPGAAWRLPDYDDQPWSTGAGPLGYGEPYVASTVLSGPITTYFRKRLRVDDPGVVKRLEMQLMYDDGAIVTVNGHEVARRSMPAGPVGPGTLARSHEAGRQRRGGRGAPGERDVERSGLRPGRARGQRARAREERGQPRGDAF
jgi:hypothetical protein